MKSFITKIPSNANLKLVITVHTDIAMPTVLFNTPNSLSKTKMSNWYILNCVVQGVILSQTQFSRFIESKLVFYTFYNKRDSQIDMSFNGIP